MKTRLSFKERSLLCQHPTAKKLFALMETKKSNLSVAADLTTVQDLLDLVEKVGSEIVVLKTHIDILKDFTQEVTGQLKSLARKHDFLLFEDRKFADIGNTTLEQYTGGIYKIADWADITNTHIVPGPGIIEGLKQAGLPRGRALLLLAEMSSSGTLATGDYTQKAVEMAEAHADFVIGFIALHKLTDDPRFIHMTPGIQLSMGKDTLGQQYLTPEVAMAQGSDILIVGRGILQDADPMLAARRHRQAGWEAYERFLA